MKQEEHQFSRVDTQSLYFCWLFIIECFVFLFCPSASELSRRPCAMIGRTLIYSAVVDAADVMEASTVEYD